jgi:Tfp pilus assembly protein PilX
MALVMALLALVVLSLTIAGIMMTLNADTKVAGHQVRNAQAFYVAQAGLAEAEARIRFGDVPNNLNPRMVTQIFNTDPAITPVPVLGTDSVALATDQPSASMLDYSTVGRSDRVLNITYKTDAARTKIYRYNNALNPAVQTTSGFPIYTITSTGLKGQDKSTIITEVCQKPFNLNVRGAMAANVGIDFGGNSYVCGHNHSIDTPPGTLIPACSGWHTGTGDLAGAWSTGSITYGGSSTQDGTPPRLPSQTGFYAGPWESLGMVQADFFPWVGAPFTTEPDPPRGIVYLDNDGITQNHTGSFAYHGGNGEGFLYIDGDVTINGNFNYVGMIYVEGDLKINGTCWILGAMVVRGNTTINIANGNLTVLYSSDAIQQRIAKYGGSIQRLSWRESN